MQEAGVHRDLEVGFDMAPHMGLHMGLHIEFVVDLGMRFHIGSGVGSDLVLRAVTMLQTQNLHLTYCCRHHFRGDLKSNYGNFDYSYI